MVALRIGAIQFGKGGGGGWLSSFLVSYQPKQIEDARNGRYPRYGSEVFPLTTLPQMMSSGSSREGVRCCVSLNGCNPSGMWNELTR